MTKCEPVQREEAKASDEVKIEDLAQLIAGMSRLLMVLQRARAFRNSGLGIAEWAALNVLAGQGPLTVARVGRAIGLPVRMAEPMVATLIRSNFIQPSAALEQGTVELTALGRSEVARVNQLLHAQFAENLRDKEKLLSAASRTINRHLVPGFQQAKDEGEDGEEKGPSSARRPSRSR
jgi:DNA-binding MarR family transcriptional regulator